MRQHGLGPDGDNSDLSHQVGPPRPQVVLLAFFVFVQGNHCRSEAATVGKREVNLWWSATESIPSNYNSYILYISFLH